MFTTFLKKPQKTTYYEIEGLNGGAKFRKSYVPTISIDKIVYIEDIGKLTTHQFLEYLGRYRAYFKNEKQLDPMSAYEAKRLHDYLMTPHGQRRIQNFGSYFDEHSFSSVLSDYYHSEYMSTMDNVFRGAPEVSRNYAEIMRGYYAELNQGKPLFHSKEIDELKKKYQDMVLTAHPDMLFPEPIMVLTK